MKKSAKEYWEERYGESPKSDNDKLTCIMMREYADYLQTSEKKRKTTVSGWVSVKDDLPKALQTVWISNGKGWTTLGCLVYAEGGWHWAETNGVIYQEDGKIVSECESDDLDVKFWHRLPETPCL